MQLNVDRILKKSAILPTRGIKRPDIPKASPMTMLDTKDRPLGATFWASATAGNSVASSKSPDTNASGYTSHPVALMNSKIKGGERAKENT